MASGFKGNFAGARLGLLNLWSFGVDIIRRIVEQHTASHERTERCQHLLTAESAGTATDSGREERANLDGDYVTTTTVTTTTKTTVTRIVAGEV